MKIETLEISGIRSALEALRLPYGLGTRSDLSTHCALIPAKYLPSKLDPTIYDSSFSSTSNLNISKKDITLLSTLVKRGPEHAKCIRGINIYAKITAPIYWWCEMETYTIGHYRLASESTMHVDCKGLKEDELIKAKSEIPMGKELTKIDMFNYQNLRNIVKQREGHRLPEWKIFIDWVKTLPYSKEFITLE